MSDITPQGLTQEQFEKLTKQYKTAVSPEEKKAVIDEAIAGMHLWIYGVASGKWSVRDKGNNKINCSSVGQNALMKTFRNLVNGIDNPEQSDFTKFEGKLNKFKKYLTSAVISVITDKIRRLAVRHNEENIEAHVDEEGNLKPQVADALAEKGLIDSIAEGLLDVLKENYTAADNELIYKKYFLGMTNREIAEELRITEQGVSKKINWLLDKIKKNPRLRGYRFNDNENADQ